MTSLYEPWADDQMKVLGFIGAIGATLGTNAFFRSLSTTKMTVAGYAVGSYLAVQTAGISASYMINKKEGVADWMEASHMIYGNRTIADKIPVVGSAMTIIPNPLGVIETLWKSGVMIGEYTNPFVGTTFEVSDGTW